MAFGKCLECPMFAHTDDDGRAEVFLEDATGREVHPTVHVSAHYEVVSDGKTTVPYDSDAEPPQRFLVELRIVHGKAVQVDIRLTPC